MKISPPKLKAILKYFCENTDAKFLGKTKLMKLFYFLDFTHIKKYGTSVTGDDYYHLKRGPIPTVIKNLIDELEGDQELAILSDTVEVLKNDGSFIHKISCVGEFTNADKDYFSEIEFETLRDVSDRFFSTSTKDIVDMSHNEAPWKKTKEVEKIPYILAADDIDCRVSKDDIELLNTILS